MVIQLADDRIDLLQQSRMSNGRQYPVACRNEANRGEEEGGKAKAQLHCP